MKLTPKQSLVAAGAIVLAVALWLFWPSGISNVANLDSRGTTIIALGDSLTAGYGATPEEAYPSRLSAMLEVPIVNAGVNGETSEGALERLDRDVLQRDPRIVIVGLGGNDYLRGVSIKATEANLRAIVSRTRDAGAMVVLLGFRFPSLQANYGAMFERVAEEEKCLFVPDLLDGILSDPALRSDAIHPNARGYAIMAERIAKPMSKLIER